MSGDPLGWAISLSHYHYRLESHIVLFDSEEETPVTPAATDLEVSETPLAAQCEKAEGGSVHESWGERRPLGYPTPTSTHQITSAI